MARLRSVLAAALAVVVALSAVVSSLTAPTGSQHGDGGTAPNMLTLDQLASLPEHQLWSRSTGPRAFTFHQFLDHYHFDQFNATYTQRGWMNAMYFDQQYRGVCDEGRPTLAPIFLVVGSRGEMNRPYVENYSLASRLAKHFKGIIFGLEHRYYGYSDPFSTDPVLGIKQLRYLTTSQVLSDLVQFRRILLDRFQALHGRKWILVGTGAKAAYARALFPHLFHGAVSSSPVTELQPSPEFVHSIATQLSPRCLIGLRTAFQAIMHLSSFPQGVEQLRAHFSFWPDIHQLLDQLRSGDPELVRRVADVVVAASKFNYEKSYYFNTTKPLSTMCSSFPPLSQQSYTSTLTPFAHWIRSTMAYRRDRPEIQLGQPALRTAREQRAYRWQECSEFGYVTGVYDSGSALFSPLLDEQAFLRACQRDFAAHVEPMSRELDLALSPSLFHHTSNIVFTNGGEDPVRVYGVPTCIRDTVNAFTIPGVAHAADQFALEWYPESSAPEDPLQITINKIGSRVEDWLCNRVVPLPQELTSALPECCGISTSHFAMVAWMALAAAIGAPLGCTLASPSNTATGRRSVRSGRQSGKRTRASSVPYTLL